MVLNNLVQVTSPLRRKDLVKLVPLLGSLILFCCWAFQQTMLEEANSTKAA
jgi:hypothetical protein